MQRGFKGIWIPAEIWLAKDLNITEKVFLVEIDSLDNADGCFASNDYFAKFFNLSKNRCSEIIKALEKKQYLTISYKYKPGTKQIEQRILKLTNKYLCIRKIEDEKGVFDNPTGVFDNSIRYSENSEDNNTLYNNKRKKEVKKKEESYNDIISSYTESEDLKDALIEFIKMRKNIKSPMTNRALKLLLTSLDKLSTNETTKIDILNQSILNNWKGVFPLKDNMPKANNNIPKYDKNGFEIDY